MRDDVPLDAAAALIIATLDGLTTQWLLDPEMDIRSSMVLLEQLLAAPAPAPQPTGSARLNAVDLRG